MAVGSKRRRLERLGAGLILRGAVTLLGALAIGVGAARPASAPETHAVVLVRQYLGLLEHGKVVASCRYWSAKVYALNDHKKDRAGIAECAAGYRQVLRVIAKHRLQWTVMGAELVHPGLVVVHTVVAGGPDDFYVRRYGRQWFLDTADIFSA